MGKVKHITDSEFKLEVLEATLPVLVDFWAPWCGPCKMLGPVLEKIAEKFGDKIQIIKINTDENPKIAEELGVSGIPSLFIFKNGEQISNAVGFMTEQALESWINKNI